MPSTPDLLARPPSHRRFAIAIVLSVLVHALFLAIRPDPEKLTQGQLSGASQAPLTVRITPKTPEVAPPPSVSPSPEPTAAPVAKKPAPRKAPTQPPQPRARDPEAATLPIVPPVPAPEPPGDMMAMVNAARERRRAAAAREAPPGEGKEPSADEARSANIARNLQTLTRPGEGTSGVFEILRKGHRTAEFAFNGWRTDRPRGWREVIAVDAGIGGDVERAIVRRMIELIRGHYSGNFHWESHRLRRVVVLSARPADNEGLEDFMMREFFGPPMLGQR